MRFTAAALLAATCAAFTSDTLREEFVQWATTHGRNYISRGDFEKRFSYFRTNHKSIQEINQRPGATFKAGHNRFSDWSREERKAFNTWRPHPYLDSRAPVILSTENLPTEVNWIDQGAVNPIQD